MDCLKPPLTSTPIGKWACPSCPDVEFPPESAPQPSSSRHPSAVTETRVTMSPPANCTHNELPHLEPPVTRSTGKGKQRMVEPPTDDEEDVTEEEEEEEGNVSSSPEADNDTATFSGSVRGRQKVILKPGRRPRKRPPQTSRSQSSKRETLPPMPVTYTKKRVTLRPPKASLKLKLRIPSKTGSEPLSSSPKRDAFEDLLTRDEADISHTVLKTDDRDRFERSKVAAEVCTAN